MVTSLFSILAYIYSLSLLSTMGPGRSQGSPVVSPEEPRRGPVARGRLDVAAFERDEDLDMQDFLGQLLSTLNLTEPGSQVKPRVTPKEPPEYMLELYNRFANDRTAAPSANIVRSFTNEDSSSYSVMPGGIRTHPLLFNVSIPHHEHITSAELRLYTLVQRDRRRYAGLDRKVTVYKRRPGEQRVNRAEWDLSRNQQEAPDMEDLEELATSHVYGKDDAWVTFDLTHQVNIWQRAESTAHRLEVHIASPRVEGAKALPEVRAEDDRNMIDVDVDLGTDGKHSPVLIVFSDDLRKSPHEKEQPNQMTDHGNNLPAKPEPGPPGTWGNRAGSHAGIADGEEMSEETLMRLLSNRIYDTHSRIRRTAPGGLCKRSPLHVEFKDIDWDSWIIQPPGYDAYECNGVCSFPLTSEVTPTRHAIVQSLLSNKISQVSPACCVPTKLDPITLLYEEEGVVTYTHKYEGMVVVECGCR
ncbi:hypothetical protein DPEC_G00335680 [Dallia pectoralis]|uniref:Uncharacterized protein n=1 Tax=Dallia pectoralis TaxID=75939 RepID=A0ACC2F6V6_DALPE|nr:hypothetical protein DPEC_G00335680 [Dallia pectoralis]